MKLKTFLLALVSTVALACSSSDDEESSYIPCTKSEIQGDWAKAASSVDYSLSFSGDSYNLYFIRNGSIIDKENGTYEIEGLKIRLTKSDGSQSSYDNGDFYFYDTKKDKLRFAALLEFYRSN
jgi:hypothetical protein